MVEPGGLLSMGSHRVGHEKMDILQIRTFLTLLSQRERFCDGVLGDAVEDGIILRLLLRIEVLRRSRV